MNVTVGDVVLGGAAVFVGSAAAAAALRTAWRDRFGLAYVAAVGSTAFVVGVVGQHAFPSATAIKRLGNAAAQSSAPGPWDAGVSVPVLGIRLTPISLAGMLIAAVGLSLVLMFEPPPQEDRRSQRSLLTLDEEDSV